MPSKPLPPSALCAPHWHTYTRVSRADVPDIVWSWLVDSASLTHRLRCACPGGFRVRVVSQGWARPRRDECQALGIKNGRRALVRRVQLLCHNEPWVFARTVIPANALRGRQRRLSRLGSRPLGAVLFADPDMQRSRAEIARMDVTHDLYHHATAGLARKPGEIWGRRSMFSLHGKRLLVSEIFLTTPGRCPQHWPYAALA